MSLPLNSSSLPSSAVDWRFCTAPMMDWSDRHCRYFWRLLSKKTRLYTEMITSGALLFGDRDRFLNFDASEHPIALQLGGSDPKALRECAKMAEQMGYDEVNLNCGCPSDRVQEGRIGACLMAEPELVAQCVDAMHSAVAIPITVKHRTGIDDLDSREHLHHFVSTVAQAGCQTFIVHARKAWLSGLSPKQNREIPPLQYDWVIALKQTFPHLQIVINGGVIDIDQCRHLLQQVDGVMMGREAYHNPFVLSSVDSLLYGIEDSELERSDVIEAYMAYCEKQLAEGVRLHHLTRHILGLFTAQPGGRLFRRHLSTYAAREGAGIDILQGALNRQIEQQHQWQERQVRSL